jgi:hypothetical protein
MWLRYGQWPDWSFKGLGFTPTLGPYLGLNKIVLGIYENCGPTAFAFGFGMLLLYAATRLPDVKYREK